MIITRDTTADKFIRYRLYDLGTGIRYNFEISEKEGYVPKYDSIQHPIRLVIENPSTPISDEHKPAIVYPGIEAISFLRQLVREHIELEEGIGNMIAHALNMHRDYYEQIPESKEALDRLVTGEYILEVFHPVESGEGVEWLHCVQKTVILEKKRIYYTNGEEVMETEIDTNRPLSEHPSSYPKL